MHYELPVHRTIMVVDVERFGDPSRTNLHQLAVRDGLYKALAQAFRKSGIVWANCLSEDRGDGALILVQPDVPKTRLVTSLPTGLVAAVSRYNTRCSAPERMRLRVALHAGEIYHDGHGVAGAAINHAFRLIEAPALRSALEASPGVLALIVSDWLFDEVVRHHPAAEPGSYRQVQVTVKETTAMGWIRVPDPGFVHPTASKDDLQRRDGEVAAPGIDRRPAARGLVGGGEALGVLGSSLSVTDGSIDGGHNPYPRHEADASVGGPGALQFLDADRADFEAAARSGRAEVTGPVSQTSRMGSVAVATRTLPRDIASFTGREPELTYLVAAVTDAASSGGVVGVCAIGGMAGVGKTALAVHAAHRIAARFPDGQFFLPLHAHTPGQQPVDPADALASLLQAAGIAAQQIPAGLEPRAWLWRDHVAGKRLLLLLDDAAGHDQVRPLLPGTAGTLVLITSRRHLTALEDSEVISLDTLPPDDAAALLVRLAGRPDLAPGDAAVRQITAVCGNLPLALGMLARQLHHHPLWTAAGLAAELAAARDRLALMEAENLSVATAFDLSYQELSPDRQRLFRRLGLHPGTDIDDYAAAALDDSDLATARRNLAGLYDHYLLTEPARGRYHMHDLIAEHASALAAADPVADRDAALVRLLDYYLHTTSTASRHLIRRTPAGPSAVTVVPPAHAPHLTSRRDAAIWMDAERVNLHASAVYAATHGQPGYAIAIPAAMHGYLRHQGKWDQVLAVHQVALNTARQTGNHQAEANALTDMGDIQYMAGDYPAAETSLTQAIELHREYGSKHGEANALSILGYVQYLTGYNQRAGVTLASALELHDAQGDRLGQAGTLAYLGRLHLATGNYPAAEASLTQALDLCLDLGHRLREAGALQFLGTVQEARGDYPAAIASQTRSLELQRDLGNLLGEANALRELGVVQQLAGDYAAAAANLNRALELHRDLGHPLGEARTLHYLSTLNYLSGDYQAISAGLARALKYYQDLGHRLGEVEVLNAIGELSLMTGAPTEARAHYEQALTLAAAIDSLPEKARAVEGIGQSELQAGRHGEAIALLSEALAIYKSIGSPNVIRVNNILRDHNL